MSELPDTATNITVPPGLDAPITRAEHTLWSQIIDDIAAPGVSMDASLHRLARRASATLSATVSIFLIRRDRLVPIAFWDDDPQRLAGVRALFEQGDTEIGLGDLGQVISNGRPLLVRHAAERVPAGEPTPYSGYVERSGLNSYLLVPMQAGNRPLGVLGIGRHGDQPPIDRSLQDVAERLATVAAQVVRVTTLVERGRLADVALNAMRDAVIAVESNSVVTFWNKGAEHMYGIPGEAARGRPITELLRGRSTDSGEPLDLARIQEDVRQTGAWMARVEQQRHDGSPLLVESLVTPLTDETGAPSGAVIVNRDVSDLVAIGSALRRQELLAQAALDASPMLTAVVDQKGAVVAASRGWSDRLGRDFGIGAHLTDITQQLLPRPADREELLRSFNEVATGAVPRTQGDYEVRAEGIDHVFSVHVTRVPDVGVAITIADITDRASRERELSYSATHDLVTRLPNRAALIDRAVHALNRAGRQGARVGLLFCDLDGFKALNDRYGHGAGDDILEFFGRRLQQSCRTTDTVARIGGDEFAVLIEDAVEDDTVQAVAQRIVAQAKTPLAVPFGRVPVKTSVGALITEPSGDQVLGEADVDLMLGQADAAMYEAKRRGKNRWVLFDAAIRAQHENRGALVGDLVRGTRSGEFLLHFQPQFDSAGALCGGEALLRWNHPTRGLIEPFDLIQQEGTLPLALGDWVLGRVAATLAEWKHLLPADFRMGVNLSRSQWMDRNTSEVMLDWLQRQDAPPTSLRVELPQEATIEDVDHTAAVSRRLSEAGIDVAINGFGTGGTQLVDLSRLTLGSVVLSRRMVRDLGRNPGAEAMLRGTVAMSRQMGWRVIATGIENDEQLDIVRTVNCHAVQGFLLGRPVPGEEFLSKYLADTPRK